MSSHDLQTPLSLASTLIVASLPASLSSWLHELEPVVQCTRLPVRLAIVATSIGEVEAASETLSSQLATQDSIATEEEPTAQDHRAAATLGPVTPLWQLGHCKSSKLCSGEGPQGIHGRESAPAVGKGGEWNQQKVAQGSLPLCFVLDGAVGKQPNQAWWQKIGVPPAGAVLVRPDGHIAWCSQGAEGSQQLLLALQEVYMS